MTAHNGSEYQEFYSPNLIRSAAIGFSVLAVILNPIALVITVWYERYRAGHVRTLINQLFTSGCLTGVSYSFLGQVPEIILGLFGPFNDHFCFIHIVVKNTILVHLMVVVTAISIVKYVYIFVIKNPSGRSDDFLCLFINMASIFNAFLYQLVLHLLPGNNSAPYWFCSGKLPDPKLHRKINYPVSFLAILCAIVYLTVLVKVKVFKRKIDVTPVVVPARQQPLPSTLAKIFSTSLADLATVAMALLVIFSTVGVVLFIGTLDNNYLRSHQYLVYLHFHGVPSTSLIVLPMIPFLQNPKLRDFFMREFRARVYDIQE